MSSAMEGFRGRTALVTGAGSGLGLGIATVLARSGATVVMTDVDAAACEQAAASLRASGFTVESTVLDVRDGEAFSACFDAAWARHGRVHLLFNNAGIGAAGDARDVDVATWRQVVEINLMGVIHGCHAAWPRMAAAGGGQIVNTASAFGLLPGPLYAAYSATKHGVVGLSRSLRAEGRDLGIGVTALCPGFIRTRILDNALMDGVDRASAEAAVPFRFLDPDKAVRTILRGVQRNRARVVFPWEIRALWWLDRLSPALMDVISAAAARRYRRVARR
ncbi:SDR family oxidoreductase [Thioalkalivibrio sp. XN279]|uniref:SDR family NAD(P)-dependent oxidoreductase n=1 Tax=Thioalkalivibrio sp. XN279 TaxID=2714953 RepID=UPI001407C0A0|nr:SDR family oxidoreductase [Thioalkalivibrio sp. XN279]NHA14376.1 SDR family oxidoreductase [Thioalkalivibrio sp. XN279]